MSQPGGWDKDQPKGRPGSKNGAFASKETTDMNIGTLALNTAGIFMGRIQTATLDLAVGLRPVTSSNAAAPKFDVMVRAKNGQFIPVGGLWEKTANNGTGKFLQGQIDDPSFEAPLSIALFAQEDGSLNVAWSRPRRRSDSPFGDMGAPAAANDGFEARHDDFGNGGSPFGDEPGGFKQQAA